MGTESMCREKDLSQSEEELKLSALRAEQGDGELKSKDKKVQES